MSGASAGLAGGLVSGVGNSLVEGNSLSRSLLNGLTSGGIGALSGGVTGGLTGGADALRKGTNYWTGKAELDLNGAYSCSGCLPSDLAIGENTITGKYVGKFQGVNVFESRRLGDIKTGRYSAVTIPERGIIAADGVFTSQLERGLAMMQHEYGHILQYRKFGSLAYWRIIAPSSLVSAISNTSEAHGQYWTETWANYLAKEYFKILWLGNKYGYPARNIGNFTSFILVQMKMLQMFNTKPRWII